jgi:predicted MFS family arabinose efflux permease
MLVSYADRLGREVGINGVWGNLGVASSALLTGIVCQYLGWRWAFVLPGLAAVSIGIWFMARVRDEVRTGHKQAAPAARVSKGAMRRVVIALVVTVIASSTVFNAVTVALPKLFAERLADLTTSPAGIGLIAAGAYVFGALAQYTIGHLLDRHSLKAVFLPLSEWRARAYAVRYFLGFTAAGASVGLVAWLHERGGFTLMLQASGALCVLVILGALVFPSEDRAPAPAAQPVE